MASGGDEFEGCEARVGEAEEDEDEEGAAAVVEDTDPTTEGAAAEEAGAAAACVMSDISMPGDARSAGTPTRTQAHTHRRQRQ